jgi:hypothetical protein
MSHNDFEYVEHFEVKCVLGMVAGELGMDLNRLVAIPAPEPDSDGEDPEPHPERATVAAYNLPAVRFDPQISAQSTGVQTWINKSIKNLEDKRAEIVATVTTGKLSELLQGHANQHFRYAIDEARASTDGIPKVCFDRIAFFDETTKKNVPFAKTMWSIHKKTANDGTDFFKIMHQINLDQIEMKRFKLKRRNLASGTLDFKKFARVCSNGGAYMRWMIALYYFIQGST